MIALEKVIQQKEEQFDQLYRKLRVLNGYNMEISYSPDLDREEQVKYAKIGLFCLWRDLNKVSKLYNE